MAYELLLVSGASSAAAALLLSENERSRRYVFGSKGAFEPVVSRLNEMQEIPWIAGLASDRHSSAVVNELREALRARFKISLNPAGTITLIGASWVVAACAGWWFSASPAGAVVCVAACATWLRLRAGKIERVRERELIEEMPGIFRSLASSLAAGRSLTQSIEHVARHEDGPAAEAFQIASMRLRCAIPVTEVLSALEHDLKAPGVDLLVSALSISQRNGSPLGGILEQAAELVERQGEFEQLLQVKTAQVRLSAHIVCALPPALCALLLLISPDYQAGMATPLGAGCVLVALGLDALALIAMRFLMKGVL